ncbi:hypothetical protein EMN47_08890 [Prolixibacteraceae bacterium JC049]|nr:hypothetical protein [Prolixibacteraceae bacterium JC049]
MRKFKLFIWCMLLAVVAVAKEIPLNKENQKNWRKVGRGTVVWQDNSVVLKDCWLVSSNNTLAENMEYRFSARALENEEQVQIWAGWAWQNRDNRYAFGLRGGNNNDLYLTHYETVGKDKMQAWESLKFAPKVAEWYNVRIVVLGADVRVYLNDEKQPRIVSTDTYPMNKGNLYIGGGWLSTEFKAISCRSLNTEEVEAFKADSVKMTHNLSLAEKETLRKKQRGSYKAIKVKRLKSSRTEIDLAGNWLFMPEQNIAKQNDAINIDASDKSWHVMSVPQFWNPVRNWLHGQDSGLPHWGSGISDNYREKEDDRCDGYTFDSKATTAAWYRHWIDLPKTISGKKLALKFDAVSKVAEVYVNGNYAGGHVGMFGNFDVDITKWAKPGKNLIAVNVKVRKYKRSDDADEHVARAVSVDINNDMLNSLPCGMFKGTEGGIWQPVKLVVTNSVEVDDLFIQPSLTGGKLHVALKNNSEENANVDLLFEIRSKKDKKLLYKSKNSTSLKVAARSVGNKTIEVENLAPKLWTPEDPNLYTCKLWVVKDGKRIDEVTESFGFRTIKTEGNKVLLNGIPYWMRGANHPPCGIAANDKKLANKFMKLMHDGNQMVTRSHGSPFTTAWMEAADEQGVGVSYEGSWPWMMIGKIPSKELLDVWKEETLSLVKKYRNHPSLMVWTMNNEMYFTMFYHNDSREVRIQKWKYLSDVIKEVRKLVPDLPISADSGYDRLKLDYEQVLKPNGIDDGDLDDRHVYFNWYNRDFFQVYNGEWDDRIYWTPGANPDRPFFAQEVSTGYLNNDEGHFCRKYIYKHYVPHAYVGDWAWEDRDPKYGLQRHAFMTKELAEVIRRTAPETAGVLLFANVSWYKNVFDADKIAEWPITATVKKAYQPVLVSAELFGREFWAGTTFNPNVYVVNNGLDGKELAGLKLKWQIMQDGETLKEGSTDFANVGHYKSVKQKVEIQLPTQLKSDKNKCILHLQLTNNGNVVSENDYDMLIAKPEWLEDVATLKNKKIGLFDLTGKTENVFKAMNIPYFKLNDLTEIRFKKMDVLVVANIDADKEVPYSWEDVRRVAGNGQKVLLIHPGIHLRWLMFDRVDRTWERPGRVLNMKRPEHDVFNDIDPMELSWWHPREGERPAACRRTYRFYDKAKKDITNLAVYLRPHVYIGNPEKQLPEMSGVALAEIKEKKGKIIASELELNQAEKDPVAAKMLINLLKYLAE